MNVLCGQKLKCCQPPAEAENAGELNFLVCMIKALKTYSLFSGPLSVFHRRQLDGEDCAHAGGGVHLKNSPVVLGDDEVRN